MHKESEGIGNDSLRIAGHGTFSAQPVGGLRPVPAPTLAALPAVAAVAAVIAAIAPPASTAAPASAAPRTRTRHPGSRSTVE